MKKLLIIVATMGLLMSFTEQNVPINKEDTCDTTVSQSSSQQASFLIQSDFCKGWDDGYCEGWKHIKGDRAICPVTPICPLPDIGEDTYKDGYNRGFVAGRARASK